MGIISCEVIGNIFGFKGFLTSVKKTCIEPFSSRHIRKPGKNFIKETAEFIEAIPRIASSREL